MDCRHTTSITGGTWLIPNRDGGQESFGVTNAKATELMLQLTAQCLTEADEIFNVRAAALHANHAC